ncbi:MAG: class I SAM-dependent methyltransferase [Thermoplasmata archaeon]|nr:class I SAM-dependent methyltransferase [Thermoplasmata archaeon]
MHDPKVAWDRRYSSGVKWGGSKQGLPDLETGARVLEIGCGTGDNTISAVGRGWRVTAIDLSSKGLDIAEKRLSDRGLKAVLLERDATLPLCDLGLFDCVLLHHVLGAMLDEERRRCVENILEVLSADGVISFLDLSVHDMRFGKGKVVEDGSFLKEDGILQHFFTEEEVRGLFSDMRGMEISIESWSQKGSLKRSRIHGLLQWEDDRE